MDLPPGPRRGRAALACAAAVPGCWAAALAADGPEAAAAFSALAVPAAFATALTGANRWTRAAGWAAGWASAWAAWWFLLASDDLVDLVGGVWFGAAALALPAAAYMFAVLRLPRPGLEAYTAEPLAVLWWIWWQVWHLVLYAWDVQDPALLLAAGAGFALAAAVCACCAVAAPERRLAYAVAGLGFGVGAAVCFLPAGRDWTDRLLALTGIVMLAAVATRGVGAFAARRRLAGRG